LSTFSEVFLCYIDIWFLTSDLSSTFHESDIPCSKRERLFVGISKESRQGRSPKESSGMGSSPKERTSIFIDVKGGEIVTLM
jgi:hypothetical protein